MISVHEVAECPVNSGGSIQSKSPWESPCRQPNTPTLRRAQWSHCRRPLAQAQQIEGHRSHLLSNRKPDRSHEPECDTKADSCHISRRDSSHISIVTSPVTSLVTPLVTSFVTSLVATLATSLVMTFVKPFIMCLAAPLVTAPSRLPSRLSWRLLSCPLSCESSPLRRRVSGLLSPVSPRLLSRLRRVSPMCLSWRLSSSLLSRMSRRPSRHISGHVSRHNTCLLSHLSSRLWSISSRLSSHMIVYRHVEYLAMPRFSYIVTSLAASRVTSLVMPLVRFLATASLVTSLLFFWSRLL